MIPIAIDRAGRIVVPKSVRDALGLEPGTNLELEVKEDSIVLRRPRPGTVMNQKNGFWVFDTGGRITPEMVNRTLAEVREKHDEKVSGE